MDFKDIEGISSLTNRIMSKSKSLKRVWSVMNIAHASSTRDDINTIGSMNVLLQFSPEQYLIQEIQNRVPRVLIFYERLKNNTSVQPSHELQAFESSSIFTPENKVMEYSQPKLPYPSKDTLKQMPTIASPKPALGKARVVRQEGATVRDGIDIDNSNEILRLKPNEEVSFDKIKTLQPAQGDYEVVAVKRLRVTVTRMGDEKIIGWASLHGRAVEDQNPILEIIKGLEADVVDLTVESPPAMEEILTSSNTNALEQLSRCPFCNMQFVRDTSMDGKNLHINMCMFDGM